METIKKTVGIILLTISFISTHQGYAQKRNNNGKTYTKTERVSNDDRSRINYTKNRRYRTQPIHRNPAYRYPHHRNVIRTLPIHHVRVMYRGLPYFYYSGVYYTVYGDEYIVVLPPRGFRITVLPINHIKLMVDTSVYFYHSGIYYAKSTTISTNNEGNYEVTQPPIGLTLYEVPTDAKIIVIDGNIYYEFNDVLYKKEINEKGEITYRVVYCDSNEA